MTTGVLPQVVTLYYLTHIFQLRCLMDSNDAGLTTMLHCALEVTIYSFKSEVCP